MKNNYVKNIVIVICILLLFTLLYVIADKLFNKEEDEYGEFLKNYKINEYIPTYISDEEMARIYLNDYVYMMFADINSAYQLMDQEYRDKKFGNFDNFKNYVYSLSYSTYNLDKYYVQDKGQYKIFGVYDKNGNLFVFKTNGVMQYTVYLDNYTVEI